MRILLVTPWCKKKNERERERERERESKRERKREREMEGVRGTGRHALKISL